MKVLGASTHECPDGSLLMLVSFQASWWQELFGCPVRSSGYALPRGPNPKWVRLDDSGPLNPRERAEVGQALAWLREKEKADAAKNK